MMTFVVENINQLWLPFLAIAAILGVLSLVFCIFWGRSKAGDLEEYAEKRAMRMVKEMEAQGKAALLDEKREWHQTRASLEQGLNDKQAVIEENEQTLVIREKEFEQRSEAIGIKEERLSILEEDLPPVSSLPL